MPRMPTGRGFSPGYSTIRPTPTPRVVQGPSSAEGAGRFGKTLMGIADDAMDRDLQDQQRGLMEAKGDEREALQLMKAEDREAAQEQLRVGRLKAANAAVDMELQIAAARADLDDQLARGIIKPDEFEGKLQGVITETQAKLRQNLDPRTHIDFDQYAIRPIRAAQLGAQQSLRNHTKREAAAELDKGREQLLRVATSDLPRALAAGQALYSRDGPYAAQIGIDEAQKQGQTFRETATRAHFLRRVADGQNDGRQLASIRQEVAKNPDLDPTQQAALLGSIDSRSTVLENRGIAAAERRSRQQDQAFKALQDLDAQGLPLDAAFLDKTMATLKGSPLADAAAAMVQGSAATASFGAKPVKEQDRIIQEEFAKAKANGVNPASSKQLQKLVGIRNAAESAFAKDPWQAANERGAIDAIPPIKIESLASLGESLTERMGAAPTVDAMAGRVVSPLRPEEADTLGQALENLPVPERVKMLGVLQAAIGPERTRAVAEQMKAKNATLGIAAAYQAQDIKTAAGVNVGELVLKGADARKNKTVKVDERAGEGLEATIRKQLEGAYATPNATDAAVEASMNVWAALQAEGRGGDEKKAIEIATGGVATHNGQKIPMPYGWDERKVKRSIASITPDVIRAQMGEAQALRAGSGHLLLPEDLAAAIPRAQLRSAGPNRYAVRIGDQLVTLDGRRPFTIALPDVK